MSAEPPDVGGSPTGLLTFRAWLEMGAQPSLRVRVTRLDDLSSSEPVSFVTADIEELVATLHDWLRRFEAQ